MSPRVIRMIEPVMVRCSSSTTASNRSLPTSGDSSYAESQAESAVDYAIVTLECQPCPGRNHLRQQYRIHRRSGGHHRLCFLSMRFPQLTTRHQPGKQCVYGIGRYGTAITRYSVFGLRGQTHSPPQHPPHRWWVREHRGIKNSVIQGIGFALCDQWAFQREFIRWCFQWSAERRGRRYHHPE
jgi:hypothetical protein